jgi:hypothetical protein
MKRDETKLWAVLAAITAVLLIYSQTKAFSWDEGFHLLAARMISLGKRPYQDFLFAQTPLNAYWNALLFRIFGAGWRVPHIAAALETAVGIALIADYIFRRASTATRLSVSVTAAILLAANDPVVWYSMVGQAYGMSLMFVALAFRFAVVAVEGPWYFAALAGMAAGAAASSTLLAAAVGPVMFVWLTWLTRGRKSAPYALGAVVGLGPALWFLIQAPHAFIFDVVGFHVNFRNADWDDWVNHDIGTLTSWLNSGAALVLMSLALAGIVIGRKRRDLVLAAWVTGASCVFEASTHPTFPQYFIPAVPFAVVLAAEGIQELLARYPRRWPLAAMSVLTVAVLIRGLWEERDDMSWKDIDKIVKAVREAKPDPKPLYADEHVYLLTGIVPISGMEWGSGHKIDVPLDQARPVHVIPRKELDRMVKAGDFGNLETCEEGDIDRMGLNSIYPHKLQIGDCYLFTRK